MAGPASSENTGADAVRIARPNNVSLDSLTTLATLIKYYQEMTTALGNIDISDPAENNPFVKPGEPSFDDIYATEAGAPPGYSEQWQPIQPSRVVAATPRQAETGSPGTSPSMTSASTASSTYVT